MDDSPMPPRMRRKSCYSLCQSDYETAAEDSDGSLYYSMFEDEEKEIDSGDKENRQMTPRNGLSSRNSLLEKCLQKNLNHTPRNEYNKRISCNFNSILSSSPTMTFRAGIGLQEAVFETENEDASSMPTSSSSTDNVTETVNDGNVSDCTEVSEEDLNGTIIAEATNATKDEPIVEAQVGAAAVTSTSTALINLKTTSIPCGPKQFVPASSNQNVSTTFGLSNLPVPKKISIADLANPPAATTTRNSHIPSSKRASLFPGRSTDHYRHSKPNGKSGIPKVSLMFARNNSLMYSSAMRSSSTQCVCEYCDKTFAKQSILDVHHLEKCEKIPPARHRQLSRQQTYPN
ncbi:hypothetical protein HA402_012491 [Bradysia odoriphaga]|nr:hypothetical protein HA402_012491 [Bradysia odoriphaga]